MAGTRSSQAGWRYPACGGYYTPYSLIHLVNETAAGFVVRFLNLRRRTEVVKYTLLACRSSARTYSAAVEDQA